MGIGRHVVSRSFTTLEGHGASSLGMYLLFLPFYFVTVFVSFFPWSIKLPWLIRRLWRREKTSVIHLRQDHGGQGDAAHSGILSDTYLLSGIAVVFIIFTLVSTKLPHYTLPAFPLLALLLARHLHQEAAHETPPFLIRKNGDHNCLRVDRNCSRSSADGGAVLPCVSALSDVSGASLQPNMQFAAVEFQEPSLVWYFRSRVRGFLTPLKKRNATEFMSASGPRFIILPTSVAGEAFRESADSWRFFTVSGFNIPKGKRVDLTLVLKSSEPLSASLNCHVERSETSLLLLAADAIRNIRDSSLVRIQA